MKVSFLLPTDLWKQRFLPCPYPRALPEIEHLRGRGVEIEVVSWIRWPELAHLPAREKRGGIAIERVVLQPPRPWLPSQALFFRRLTRAIAARAKASGADAFVVHDPELLPAAIRAAGDRPILYDAHEDFPAMVAQSDPLRARLWAILERWAVRKIAHVYTVSEGIAEKFRRLGVATTVIYNSKKLEQVASWIVPRSEARRELGVGEDDFVVGFHGSLEGGEGLDVLFDALERVPPRVRVLIHGGPEPERVRLEAFARSKGLLDRVWIRAPIPEPDLFRLSCGLDAASLLLPDKGPNWRHRAPCKLFDFLALGVPMLATALPEPRRIIEDAGAGIFVAPEPGAVAEGLMRLVEDGALRRRLGEAGRRAFRERYAAERMEERRRESHPIWR